MEISYNIYPSLLDAFAWAMNTEADVRDAEIKKFIDKVNRVPFESDAADRGTTMNNLVDAIVENRAPKDVTVNKVAAGNDTVLECTFKGKKQFNFMLSDIRHFSNMYEGGMTQYLCEGDIETKYGYVHLYGYIDYLMPLKVHDMKTTGSYAVGKFKDHWQHIVYPFCLQQMGMELNDFDYDIAELDKNGNVLGFYTESYSYVSERDERKLRFFLEDLIAFLEQHRSEITDEKVFNYRRQNG